MIDIGHSMNIILEIFRQEVFAILKPIMLLILLLLVMTIFPHTKGHGQD